MSHTSGNILLHVIISTHGRRPQIKQNFRADLLAYLGGIIREMHGSALIINGAPDHVHMLIRIRPAHSAAEIVRVAKANSSRWVHENWARDFAWQTGYGVFSVSESNVAKVKKYIADQEEHHRKHTFQEEFVAFLKKNTVAYDEKYIWNSRDQNGRAAGSRRTANERSPCVSRGLTPKKQPSPGVHKKLFSAKRRRATFSEANILSRQFVSFAPFRGWLKFLALTHGLAPWAVFFRRFAASVPSFRAAAKAGRCCRLTVRLKPYPDTDLSEATRGSRRSIFLRESFCDAVHGRRSGRPGRGRSLRSCWRCRGGSRLTRPSCGAG